MSTGILYIVATPIGNLSDMTFRAVDTLRSVDVIAAEDTRNTMKLLNHFEIKKPLVSYHEHNKFSRGREILNDLLDGKSYALVSDAGMPAVSDPGEELVNMCHEEGVAVNVVPGASAAISAFAAAGFGGGRFCFEGFLPTANRRRLERIDALKHETRTVVFYEAPHKLISTLKDLCGAFGAERRVVIARELTKKYEEIFRTTLGEALMKYESAKPLGEFVLVVEGAGESADEQSSEDALERANEIIKQMKKEGARSKDILAAVCAATGMKRNEAYDLILSEK